MRAIDLGGNVRNGSNGISGCPVIPLTIGVDSRAVMTDTTPMNNALTATAPLLVTITTYSETSAPRIDTYLVDVTPTMTIADAKLAAYRIHMGTPTLDLTDLYSAEDFAGLSFKWAAV